MKIKDVINEAWGMGYDPKTGRAKGVLGNVISNVVGAENYGDTGEWNINRKDKAAAKQYAKNVVNNIKGNAGAAADAMVNKTEVPAPQATKFQQQFELVDNDPPTVQYKNNTFQRDQYGKWIDFRTGKEAPERFTSILDKVSPLATSTEPAGTSLPVGATGKPTGGPKTAAKKPWAPRSTGPAVWRSNRPAATAPAATPTQAKARMIRNNDGSITVTDKLGKKWSMPANINAWRDESGTLYQPGHPEYEKLSNFVKNLRETSSPKRH